MSDIEIHGVDGVMRMLKPYTDPAFKRRMQSAVKAGGLALQGPLRAESGRVSKRMAKAVYVVQTPTSMVGRHDKVTDPHVFVGYRRKTAFFAHMVIGGTREHGPRKARAMVFSNPPEGVVAHHVRGVRPNPIVARVASAHESQAYSAVWRDLDKTEK